MVRSEGCHRKRSGRLTQILSLALIVFWPGLAAAAVIPRAVNLAALARLAHVRHVPIVLLFWSPGCRYCRVVDRDFLGPAASTPRFRDVIFRRIDIDSHGSLRDFAGRATTYARFARQSGVTLVPDIRFYNPKGGRAAAQMLGLSTPAFYGSYLYAALQKAQTLCRKS